MRPTFPLQLLVFHFSVPASRSLSISKSRRNHRSHFRRWLAHGHQDGKARALGKRCFLTFWSLGNVEHQLCQKISVANTAVSLLLYTLPTQSYCSPY